MFAKLLHYPSLGISLRFDFTTVIVSWIFVKVCKHKHLLVKLYENPLGNIHDIVVIILCILAGVFIAVRRTHKL